MIEGCITKLSKNVCPIKHWGVAGIAPAGGSARSAKEQFLCDREAVSYAAVKKALGRLATAGAMPATPSMISLGHTFLVPMVC
jgi:hypothetical protein